MPPSARRTRRRVADERDAARRPPPRSRQHRLVGEVVAVDDHLHVDVAARQRDADDAGIARAERPHRVEEVRDGRDAEVERRVRLLRGRVRVPGRDDDAALEQRAGSARLAPGELRRERELRDAAGVEQPVEQLEVGIAPVLAADACRAARARGTALRRARRRRAATQPFARHRAQRVEHRALRRGDERRLVRGDARLRGARSPARS